MQILIVYRKEDLNCVRVFFFFQQTISNPNNQFFHLLPFNTNHPSVTLHKPRVFATRPCVRLIGSAIPSLTLALGFIDLPNLFNKYH